jgi:transposase
MKTTFKNYWGIDVSKKWLDIATGDRVIRIDQTQDAIENFLSQIDDLKQVETLITLESTGGYERMAIEYFSKKGFKVNVAHPTKVKSFARAKGRLAKTDAIDANVLREYGRFIEFAEIRELPSKIMQELRSLGSRVEQLKEMHHQESCRLGIALEEVAKESIRFILQALKAEIEKIEEEMYKKISSSQELKEKYDLVRTMKGVGPTLALKLISSLPELGIANKKEIAALVGVAPITHQSGQKTGKAMTKYGRHGVRKILYMGALAASRHNSRFKYFYEKLIAAGKPKKVALVAVMRKMLIILNAMVMSRKAFSS